MSEEEARPPLEIWAVARWRVNERRWEIEVFRYSLEDLAPALEVASRMKGNIEVRCVRMVEAPGKEDG